MSSQEITLKLVTREIHLYGKNGKAQGPTKAYPHARIIIQEGELIKDFGSISVWKFPPDPRLEIAGSDFWVSYHGLESNSTSGSAYKTEEDVYKSIERTLASREYHAKRKEIWRAYQANLAVLDEEYKGRI